MPFVSYDPDPANPGVGWATDDRGRRVNVDTTLMPSVVSLPPTAPAASPSLGVTAVGNVGQTPAALAVTPPAARALTPAAQAVLAKRDAVLGPLVNMGGSTTTSVSRGIAPAQLNPVLDANTRNAETQASAVEEFGRQKSEREAAKSTLVAEDADTKLRQAASDEMDARNAREAARKEEMVLRSQTDPEIEPDRFVKSLSTGKSIAMIVLAAINGAFKQASGQGGNDVLDILNNRINQDIDAQKEQISSGRLRRGNLIAGFMQQGLDAKQAELAAKAQISAQSARLFEAEAARMDSPEAYEQAKLQAAGLRAQAAQHNNELKLSLGTDRVQTQSTTQMGRQQPAALSLDDVYKQGQIAQQQLEELDANEVARIISEPDADGKVRPVSIKRANAAVKGAEDLAVKMPRADVAEQQLRNVLKAAGVPDEAYNSETGTIDWSKASDLRGVGPLDSRPSLKALPLAPAAKMLNMAGLTRTDTEDVHDAAAALTESITFMTTGAVADKDQRVTFRAQAGETLANEQAFKENLSRTANQIATQRKSMLSGNADATKMYNYLRNRGNTPSLRPGVN